MVVVYGTSVLVLIFGLKIILANQTNQNQIISSTYTSEECGVSDAILSPAHGSSESPINAWPWMAALFLKRLPLGIVLCSGALISHRHILTAGHCLNELKSDDLIVHLGEHDVVSHLYGVNSVEFGVKEVYVYEKYLEDPFHYDIGVLEINGTIEYSYAIRPVCLPTKDMSEMSFDYEHAYIAGWGRRSYQEENSTKLSHIQLQVKPNEICGISYAGIIEIKSNQLCAGYRLGGQDACHGDSGAPLVITVNNTWFAIGVISLSIKCAESGFPGIFARTTFYIDWLRNITEL